MAPVGPPSSLAPQKANKTGFRSARQFPWTKEEDALPGKLVDREVAEKLNRTLAAVRGRRRLLGKADEMALLGKMPDEEVVRQTGHSLGSVRWARFKRGIFSVRRAAPDWTPEEEALLGAAPDLELAARLNRTPLAVQHRRAVKGIAAWKGARAD